MVAAGIAIGLVAAGVLTRSLATLLFDVEPFDPLTLSLAPALLGVVALIACVSPAVRAARVSPSVALPQE